MSKTASSEEKRQFKDAQYPEKKAEKIERQARMAERRKAKEEGMTEE